MAQLHVLSGWLLLLSFHGQYMCKTKLANIILNPFDYTNIVLLISLLMVLVLPYNNQSYCVSVTTIIADNIVLWRFADWQTLHVPHPPSTSCLITICSRLLWHNPYFHYSLTITIVLLLFLCPIS